MVTLKSLWDCKGFPYDTDLSCFFLLFSMLKIVCNDNSVCYVQRNLKCKQTVFFIVNPIHSRGTLSLVIPIGRL